MANQEQQVQPTTQVVSRLQRACATAFTEVMSTLTPGKTEQEIADALRRHLANQGLTQHWYDVPFVVLIGVERFRIGLTTPDYTIKAPSPDVRLEAGLTLHADFSPMDPDTGIWGDWSSTCIFRPTTSAHSQQLAFLETMRRLHRKGITLITAQTTGAEVAEYFLDRFAGLGVQLADVRDNVGHSIHAGPKSQANRTWLDLQNNHPLGPGIFTVEPGGITEDDHLVARFEECIHIPESGPATVVDSGPMVPLDF
jgi:Xaa-Pro aminopeptidase